MKMAPIGITSKPLLILIFPILIIQANALLPLPPTHLYECVNGTNDFDLFGDNSLTSTTSLLSDLASNSSTYSFYSSQSGSGRNASYGLFYCTANVNAQDCQTCVETAAKDVQWRCMFYKVAYVFSKDCTLRYSNSTVSATEDESVIAWFYSTLSVSYSQFNNTLYSTLNQLIPQAADVNGTNKGYATGEARLVGTSEKLYALAQCTPDILGRRCEQCLQFALENMPLFCGNSSCLDPQKEYIATLLPSCQLSYEVRSPSSSNGSPPLVNVPSSSPGDAGMNIWLVIMLALAVATFALD